MASDPLALHKMVEEAFRKTVTQLAAPAPMGTEFPLGMGTHRAVEQMNANAAQQEAPPLNQRPPLAPAVPRGTRDGTDARATTSRTGDDDKTDRQPVRGRSRSHGRDKENEELADLYAGST